MGVKEKVGSIVLDRAVSYISNDPQKNMPKLLNWLDSLGLETFKTQSRPIHEILDDPENNWYKFIMDFWKDIDNDQLKVFFQNFAYKIIVNYAVLEENTAKYGHNFPLAMLIDPTSACNLKCKGCWSAEYGQNMNLSNEVLDDAITQGEELGINFVLLSGGEPLVRKADILKLFEAHPSVMFGAFTNGTLIDEEFCQELSRLKNFIPILSLEGFEEATDYRRGAGTFAKVKRAAELLKAHKLLFGFSACYTGKNVDSVGSEEFYDLMIDWGAKFVWFFTYMPVGEGYAPELMVSAEQREFMYNQVRKFRDTKPLFSLDFWNDGEYAKGCVAGGRRYLHINANGDIEPCAFIHYSDSNIHEKTILEALKSPLFMAYHKRQPFNENHLRVCPLLDNPEILAEMVDESGAYSTDLRNPEDVHVLSGKCNDTAANWHVTADKLWACSGKCSSKWCVEHQDVCNSVKTVEHLDTECADNEKKHTA